MTDINVDIPASVDDWKPPEIIGANEWTTARAAPACIVEDYLFAEVGCFIAPGGMGKTTLTLFEAIHIALGLPLYGLQIYKPGTVVILTAEDSRDMLVARLRSIAEAMGLTAAQIAEVQRRVRISDVTGGVPRLTAIIGDMVRPSGFVDVLADGLIELEPVLLVIDPAVSFGVGESRVNDAEQGLIEAGRRLRRALTCGVRYVHHSGKQNARDKTTDQYSGRGGSAFADGSRMVHVLQSLDAGGWLKATGETLMPGESGLILARPKISYCPPQGDILIRRAGYRFEVVKAAISDPAEEAIQNAKVVHDALVREYIAGRRHTQNSACTLQLGISRNAIKDGIHWLLAQGEIVSRDIEKPVSRGARTYLYPVVLGTATAHRAENEPKTDSRHADENPFSPVCHPIGKTGTAHREVPLPVSRSLGVTEHKRHTDGTAAQRDTKDPIDAETYAAYLAASRGE